MAMITNLLVFLMIAATLVQVVGPSIGIGSPSLMSKFFAVNATQTGLAANTGDYTTNPLYTAILASLALGAITGMLVSILSGGFPNPYTIFAGAVIGLLINFVTIPYDLFYSLPSPFNFLLGGGLTFILIWSIIDWYKTGYGGGS